MESILEKTKSPHTKKSYQTAYNRLMKSGLFKRSIETTGNKTIVENINQITDNPNTASSLLNICLLIKREYGMDTEELVRYRDKLKKLIEEHHKAQNETLQESLPSYDDILQYTNDAYKKKEYLKFVVNFLLMYGVRNKDINCCITYDKKRATDPNTNYLVVLKSYVIWIRNEYKTVGKYGQKTIVIRNRKFMNAITKLEREDGKYLLLNESGQKLSESSLSGYIQKLTLDGLGEGNYMKILLFHNRTDMNKLREFSQNRGTNAETLINRYNITNTA